MRTVKILGILATLILFTLTAQAESVSLASRNQPIVSTADLSKQKDQEKDRLQTEKLDKIVGATFWIKPNKNARHQLIC